jgi:hypothetical protein
MRGQRGGKTDCECGSGRLLDARESRCRRGQAPAEGNLLPSEAQELAAPLGTRGGAEEPRSEKGDEATGEDERCEDEGESTIHGPT